MLRGMAGVDLEALGQVSVTTMAGDGVALSTLFSGKPCLLIFLRHFGCVACAEQVTQLSPRLRELDQLGVGVIFIGNGEKRYMEAFVQRHALSDKSVQVVSDVSLSSFRVAGLMRSWWSVFGPRALYGEMRARGQGHQFQGIEGDGLQQGGALLLDSKASVLLHYKNRATGDFVDPNAILGEALKFRARVGRSKGAVVA